MIKQGRWLEPKYSSKDTFEKDYSILNLSPIIVKCPGCLEYVSLNKKSKNGKSAGWCKKCNRAVTI